MDRNIVLQVSMKSDHRGMSHRVLENLLFAINKKKITVNDTMDLIKAIFNIVDKFGGLGLEDKKMVVVETLEDIVAGPDGILFTNDDLLPRHVLEGLEMLIYSNFLFATIDLVYELSQAKAAVRYSCWFSRCLDRLCCCGLWSYAHKEEHMPLLNE